MGVDGWGTRGKGLWERLGIKLWKRLWKKLGGGDNFCYLWITFQADSSGNHVAHFCPCLLLYLYIKESARPRRRLADNREGMPDMFV